MSHSLAAVPLPRFATVLAAAKQPRLRPNPKPQNGKQKITTTNPSVPPATVKKTTSGFNSRSKEPTWQCVQNCGACCKLDKGPNFPTAEEIFDDPSDVELFQSMVGSDGWCIHFEKSTRKCSIYADRPYFCRVEPAIFETLYGIETKKFNKEACSSCIDTIKAIYGSSSKELENYNAAVWSST
ncbi:uncharacterized protein LOC107817168 [Nicotiana tabacum]|uniref:Uncharacterized protein LOC107817168 n=3 Tax=Nicotiana TaxID=4085 RepID=A0AC58S196_TOBAC|nr:PREDICTED: uncharacterized protein LOC104216604 [Nicotiana sylvestris]XP_016498430.1 PREDICTED: uncharacterized protein LOC107817168 [Nicotiana tabacum]